MSIAHSKAPQSPNGRPRSAKLGLVQAASSSRPQNARAGAARGTDAMDQAPTDHSARLRGGPRPAPDVRHKGLSLGPRSAVWPPRRRQPGETWLGRQSDGAVNEELTLFTVPLI
jgi:hypothetical protein